MAGWGGPEQPEAPMAEEEEAGRGSAIGAPGSGHPPPCVTSQPTAHFQATGWGREPTLGCPGKLCYLGVGDHLQGTQVPGESQQKRYARSCKIRSRSCPQNRWFCRHYSPSFSIPKAGDRVGDEDSYWEFDL